MWNDLPLYLHRAHCTHTANSASQLNTVENTMLVHIKLVKSNTFLRSIHSYESLLVLAWLLSPTWHDWHSPLTTHSALFEYIMLWLMPVEEQRTVLEQQSVGQMLSILQRRAKVEMSGQPMACLIVWLKQWIPNIGSANHLACRRWYPAEFSIANVPMN